MVEIGDRAVLTDDRSLDTKTQWFGRKFMRGAWHLYHVACHADFSAEVANLARQQGAA